MPVRLAARKRGTTHRAGSLSNSSTCVQDHAGFPQILAEPRLGIGDGSTWSRPSIAALA